MLELYPRQDKIGHGGSLPAMTYFYALLCTLGFTLILFFVPYQIDDFWYINPYRDYKFGINPHFNFTDGIESLKWHYYYDNARLANMSTPITLVLFPKWLFNILSGIVLWFMFYFELKLGAYRTKADPATDCMLISTCVLLLPWFNFILTADFFLNYVWSAAAMLLFLWLIITPEKVGKLPPWLKIIICIFMIPAGAMHEAASAPACLSAAYIIFTDRGQHTKIRMILLGCFALGTAWVCFAPSVLSRFNSSVGLNGFRQMLTLNNLLTVYLYYVFFLESIIVLSFKRFRKKLTDYRINIVLVALSISVIFSFIITQTSGFGGARTGFIGYVFAIPAIWLMFRAIGLHSSYWVSILAATVSITNLCVTAYYQYILKNEHDIITEKMLNTDQDYIVHDIMKGNEISPLTLGKTCKSYLSTSQYDEFNKFYRPDQSIAIVPSIVSNTPAEECEPIDKENNIYQIGDYLFAKNSSRHFDTGLVTINYNDGSSLHTYVQPMNYSKGNDRYCFFMLWQPRNFYGKYVESIAFE